MNARSEARTLEPGAASGRLRPSWRSAFRSAVCWIIYPTTLALSLLLFALAFERFESTSVVLFVGFLLVGGLLYALEWLIPYEPRWNLSDGQIANDLGHTAFSSLFTHEITRAAFLSAATSLSVWLGDRFGGLLWPGGWPLPAQVVLALAIGEFTFYWMHRLKHEVPLLWRFHVMHHSAPRLSVLNGGRVHPVESVSVALFRLLLIAALGAPAEVLLWMGASTAVLFHFTHTNADVRTGWLSWIFNTPELHRWHHSRVSEEGNTNYGDVLMLWDHVFGTFFLPKRRPPVNIGTDERVPSGFLAQIALPFTWSRRFQFREIVESGVAGDPRTQRRMAAT